MESDKSSAEWTAYGGTERYERDMRVAPAPKRIDPQEKQAEPSSAGEEAEKSSYYFFDSSGKKVKNKWDSFDFDAALADEKEEEEPEAERNRPPPRPKPTPKFPPGPWACSACTFLNCSDGPGDLAKCEMCGTPRKESSQT